MDFKPLHFVGEPIEVFFSTPPTLEKKPGCPQGFTWRSQTFTIIEMLSEWHDYRRRGHMANNMQPQHAAAATRRGSWGVGQDYYRVRTQDSRFFDLYYDRSPKDSNQRKGAWFLDKELITA